MTVFDKIIPFIARNTEDSGSVIYVDDHTRIPIRKSAFIPFSPQQNRVCFVDGGNGEILRGPNVSLHYVKLYASLYDGKERLFRKQEHFFIFVHTKKKDLDFSFEASLFDMEGELLDRHYSVSSLDPSLMFGGHRVLPSTVAEHIRVVEEFRFMRFLINHLDKKDMLVRDGDFACKGPYVEDEVRKLRLSSEKYGISCLGLSKTSRLCTDSGSSALRVLSRFSPAGVWAYFSDGSVGFTKLHAKSKYVFRFDVFSHDRENLIRILQSISYQADDPLILGYPYGLIEADKSARVSNIEVSEFRSILSAKAGSLVDSFESAVDIHDFLNKA